MSLVQVPLKTQLSFLHLSRHRCIKIWLRWQWTVWLCYGPLRLVPLGSPASRTMQEVSGGCWPWCSGLLQWYILELSLSRDHPVSCSNWFSVQLSFPIVHSSGVRAALSDKSRAFSSGDIPGFSSAVCLYKWTARQCNKVAAWPTSGCTCLVGLWGLDSKL